MAKPTPKLVRPEELVDLALNVLRADKFPVLATVDDDQPRARPVSPVRTEGFTVFVANLRQYNKTHEIATNPKVELCYMDEAHNQVRITGFADILTDPATLQSIWDDSPLMRQYLGSISNPALIVYQINPARVRYMQEWALEYYEVPFKRTGSD